MNKYLVIKNPNSKLNDTICDFVKGMVGFIKIKTDEDNIIINYDNFDDDQMLDALLSLTYDIDALIKCLIISNKNEEEFEEIYLKIKKYFYYNLKSNIYTLKDFYFENVDHITEFKDLIFKRISYDYDYLEVIKKFIENNMNVLKTSKLLYMHRNTLINKLDRFHQVTGYDPKEFKDAYVLYSILK